LSGKIGKLDCNKHQLAQKTILDWNPWIPDFKPCITSNMITVISGGIELSINQGLFFKKNIRQIIPIVV
jgi:hypothetical protein